MITLDPQPLARHASAVALVGLLLVLGPACGPPVFPASARSPLLGQALPEMSHRQTVDGRPLPPVQGPALVKFFADYCQPCKTTLPAVQRIHDEYPDVTFIGIDEDESRETGQDLARRYGLTFPVVHDAGNALAGRFRVSVMPATFVTDRAGTIRWVGAEGQTEDELRQAVRAALAAPVAH